MVILCKIKNKYSAKMRIIFLLSILLLSVFSTVNGQSVKKIKRQISYRNLSHVKDKEQYGFGGGANYNGYNVSLFYAKYLKSDILVRGDLFYEHANLSGLTALNLFYLSPEINYTVAKPTNRFFVNIKGGIIIGNERLNNSIMVNKKLSSFVIGEKIGVKLEYFIVPEISINFDLEQRFFHKSKVGAQSALLAVSLSYNL